jgi:rhodanese-related sulfurtransferase
LQTILSTQEKIQLVDVRTPQEWKKGTVKNALKINVTSDSFEKKALEKLDKKKPVYVYCRSGGRSKIASEILVEKGFEVYNVEGGYLKWQEEIKE